MALSSIIRKECPTCGKVAVEASRIDLGTSKLISLVCGHLTTEEVISSEVDYSSIVAKNGFKLRPYQVEGIKFGQAANARVLIADEQGLGKTIQAIGLIRLHSKELLPVLAVTKTTLKHQWFYEFQNWCNEQQLLVQVLNSSKEKALPGFDIYITTYDLLKNEELFNLTGNIVKTVIIDECQAIKNHLSDRAKAVQDVCETAEHIIALSGTPIKNNAGEYFTILNILQPSRFPSYSSFLSNYCDAYETQYGWKVGGLKDPEYFKQMTSDFIIRRSRKEAAPDIPDINRQFFHVELDKKLNKAYAAALAELEELYYRDEGEDTTTTIIAIMTKMRKITGISKVPQAVDFAVDFLLNNATKKLVIFAHHHDVVTLLELKLNEWLTSGGYSKCLNLHSGLSAEGRSNLVKQFKDDSQSRIMIASTLAAGEGLNLQFCDTAIMLERQWNPANEEQAEGRFARIGQESEKIDIIYMLASETIDEYFTELVEQKRAIVASTLDHKEINWESNSLLKELAGVLVNKGKKKWVLPSL